MSQEQLSRPEASAPVPISAEEQPQHQQQHHEPAAFADVSPVSEEQPEQPQHKPEVATDLYSTNEEQASRPVKPTEATDASAELSGQHEHQTHPKAVTYGDVFPAAAAQEGPLAAEAITMEDASLMQTAEAMAFGHTLKGGAASAMQSAAAKNVADGLVEKDAHSKVSEYGLSVSETSVPGATMDVEYVAGQPISASAHPTPTATAIASLDAVTIGEALEAVAVGSGDRPVDASDARAIESAERRATGVSMPMKGGIGATAQSAAALNKGVDKYEQTTLADVLMDATADLPADKVVTYEDAFRVIHAELHGQSIDKLKEGGVGASLIAAADLNEQSMFPTGSIADESSQKNLGGEEEDEDAIGEELRKYHIMKSSASDATKQSQEDVPPSALGSEKPVDTPADLTKPTESVEEEVIPLNGHIEPIASTEEETTPLVHNGTEEKVPSHGSEQLPAPKQTEI